MEIIHGTGESCYAISNKLVVPNNIFLLCHSNAHSVQLRLAQFF